MFKIECGPAIARYEIGNDGILRTTWSGLIVPANAGELSARLLRIATHAGARAVLSELEGVLLAIPPVNPNYYRYVPEDMRAVPVSFVVSGEQAQLYRGLAQAAASNLTLRRAVRSSSDGEDWLQQQVRAFTANQVWWDRRRRR